MSDEPRTEAERLALYHALVADGLSDAEARATAWPETAANEQPSAAAPAEARP